MNEKEYLNRVKSGGAIPSEKDDRDYKFVASVCNLPEEYMSPETKIMDQLSVGSCVAHALVTAMERGELSSTNTYNDYSRGYIYGNRRATDHQGEGMQIRQALKQLNHCGDCLYLDFPYNLKYQQVKELIEINKDKLAEKALPYAIDSYFVCSSTEEIKRTIMNNGSVIICVAVYDDFGKDIHITKTNVLEGYHAMAIVGWTKDYWTVQNSWGEWWGYKGYAHMDYNYPLIEAWGINVKSNPKPKKENIIITLYKLFLMFLKRIFK